MSTETGPTVFGGIFAPRADWLARAPAEEIIDRGLAITARVVEALIEHGQTRTSAAVAGTTDAVV